MSNSWQRRKADTDEERFGLLDPVTRAKYKKQPVFQAPEGEAPESDLIALGITSGIGSMLVGAHASGFRVIGNVEWRDYYRYRSKEGQPSTFPHNFPGAFMARGLADVPRDLVPGRIDFAAGHPESFHPSVPVYTSRGWKPIGEVKEGDLVLTHKGRFRRVYRAFHYECPANTEEVTLSRNSRTSGSSLVTTMNHPLLMKDGSWKAAGDVRKGDEVMLLADTCPTCQELAPVVGACGCGARQYWAGLNEEQRQARVRAANEKTRERVANGEHQFSDPGIRRKGQLVQARSSEMENQAFRLLVDRGFKVERQFIVGDFFVDLALPDYKIALEVDGGNWHMTSRKQEQDRRKVDFLKTEGWTVVRTPPRPDRWQGGELEAAVDEVCRIASNHEGVYQFGAFKVGSLRRRAMEVGEPLCNLSVEEDESYIANGWVVHNCGRFSKLIYSVTRGDYQETRSADASDIPLFLRMVAKLRPRFFLMDDLPASFKALPMQAYIDILPEYDLFPEWVSNWGYGNVQEYRNRMFVVGSLKSEKFTFIPGEAEHTKTLKDVIGHLTEFQPGELPNHAGIDASVIPGRYVNLRHYGDRPTWEEVREFMKDPDNFRRNTTYFTSEGEQKARPGTRNPLWDGSCPVLSGGYNPLHPLRLTPLTIRERAAIQGFPDDFLFFHDEQGPEAELWEPYKPDGQRGIKQTGKAMPTQFCTFVSDQVKAHIEKKPFEASGQRLLKPNAQVSQAKLEFCEASGYSDQDAACAACWLRDTCHIYKANNTTGE